MTNLGVYYAPEHGFQVDRDYIAALQPPVIRILDPDVQHIADMHALAPNAVICPRTWAIDDGSDEDHPSKQVNRLMADPLGTGRDHAQQYAAQWDRWTSEASQRGLKLPNVDRILFNSANEPNQGGTPDKIAAYSVAFLDRCTELGIRACAPCLGVGWPDNTGPDTPVNWKPYADAGLEQAIKRNGGMLSIHEYFYKTGPQDGWRWLAGRHLQCPFDVPILLGEMGIDNYVDKARWDKEGGNRGWQGNVSPDQYAEMIEYHITHSDKRVVAGLIFITDYRNNSWESFNTRAAHNALLSRKDRMVPQVAPPSSPGPQPVPPPTGPTATPITPAGARIRSGPEVIFLVLGAVAKGVAMRVTGKNAASTWYRVDSPFGVGWVSHSVVRVENVGGVPVVQDEPPVQPPAQEDTWARSLAFTLRWEGLWADDPNDKGKATMKGVTIGTYTRWRKAHGQPVPTKDDLRNIGDAEVSQIYFEWYWIPSGAAALSWPQCLAVFDLAVIGGPDKAKEFVGEVGTDFVRLMARRILWHTNLDDWPHFGYAWTRRCADLMKEGS